MKIIKISLIILLALNSYMSFSQEQINSKELLEKSIKYHDPNSQWASFVDSLYIVMESPNKPARHSHIFFNFPKNYFSVTATRAENTIKYIVDNDSVSIHFNGKNNFTKEEVKENRLNTETAILYRNYYTFLYGLPMKLKDEGTNLAPFSYLTKFKDTTYWTMEVSYEKEVGTDFWKFYFDTKTYALKVYQFYKSDENGKPKSDSGEYILLDSISEIQGIKIPKNRRWYYNKDDKYLGSDLLK